MRFHPPGRIKQIGVEVAAQEEIDLAGGAAGTDAPAVAGQLGTRVDAAPARECTVDEGAVVGREGVAARVRTGRFATRYAGATLLYAFFGLADAEAVLAAAVGARPTGGAGARFDDLAVLTATSVCFGLGFASLEQAKHPDRAQVGPAAGIDVLPELRTLRPRLAAIADACDPLAVQRSLAEAMLRAEPNLSGVYFVDEHFVAYRGAKPVGSGWNTKRPPRRARCPHQHLLGITAKIEPSNIASTRGGATSRRQRGASWG